MSSTIQVRVEDELKLKADRLFKDLGTDTTSAVRMFLTQAVATDGFPFQIKKIVVEECPFDLLSKDEIIARLERSIEDSENGRLTDVDVAIKEMRAKYGV